MITVNKLKGETPLECLERVRIEKGISTDIPMTYAGRLDPLAEGVLVLLTGDECKNKDAYLGLDKIYDVEVLIGVQTDTGDVLGIIESVDVGVKTIDEANATQKIASLIGVTSQEYPVYSSKPVDGKPLFAHARAGTLDTIDIPTKQVEIYSIDLIEIKKISGKEIYDRAVHDISLVKGDFRQESIVAKWNDFERQYSNQTFTIIKIRTHVSSGAYMRTLAREMGKLYESTGIALNIKRTHVGEYTI